MQYLCDVNTTERPILIMLWMQFHRALRALGSMPVVGSSWDSINSGYHIYLIQNIHLREQQTEEEPQSF